ncbi:DUF418 domain-containing protein [Actinokineospora globicatena]|uniref:DUF418 domain-containing protein n=1 Tax=Actinokineospora globicatena TaxID=103729 RepID=A0A9W6QIU8_9PSEU|nr:DUF418 domain-containing protein [Actinokineospora globicatena]GLW89485.1 hypothetical protein Aglo03_03010 [Actinokineospora globicatena]
MRRVESLDVLRGVAILGTFGTNVWIFSSPGGLAAVLGGGGVVESGLRALSNGKFLALLSILFGVGLAIQHSSALRRGARWPGWYLWRSALLLVEGVLHFVLVFEFDVLMFYAVVAVQCAFIVGRSTRVIRGWMIAAGVLHVAVVGLLTAALYGKDVVGDDAADTSRWLDQVAFRLDNALALRAEAVFVLPLGMVLFLAGARLLRAGALEQSVRGDAIRRRLMTWGLGVGVPLNALTAFAGTDWALVDRYLCAPLVAFGLLGAITTLVHRTAEGPLRRGITAVGRSALSCYIAQNVLASVLCYQWGLGVTGGPLWTVTCFLIVSALVTAGAWLWLRRFPRGPVETVWDVLYRAPQRISSRRTRCPQGRSA